MDEHEHCLNCVNRSCQLRHGSTSTELSCAMEECLLRCGARFHACKQDEHELLCPLATVACTNASYGCTKRLLRCHLGKHIAVCPASIVVCSMEWNRWSAESDERSKLPFCTLVPRVQSEQLDAAWAVRDQRMLERSFATAINNTLEDVLRSPLSPSRLVVPLSPRQMMAAGVGDAESATMVKEHGENRCKVGLGSGATWRKKLVPARSIMKKVPYYKVRCSLCSDRGGDDHEPCLHRGACGLSGSILAALSADNTYHENDYDSDDLTSDLMANLPFSSYPRTVVDAIDYPYIDKDAVANNHLECDLGTETYNSFRIKPASMYTFRCSEDFRRDEYAMHYQNVHADIQAGLNGWFEDRCPLVSYGCAHSFRRFAASRSGDCIVYSSLTESFGIRTSSPGAELAVGLAKESVETKLAGLSTMEAADVLESLSSGRDLLTSLPVEVLHYLLLYLDPFTLKSVSLTCKVLRDASCRMLDQRGMVVLLWENVSIKGDRPTWQQTAHLWSFSKQFVSVKQWHFSPGPSMSNHLKSCPFNDRCIHTDVPSNLLHLHSTDIATLVPGTAPVLDQLAAHILLRRARSSSANCS